MERRKYDDSAIPGPDPDPDHWVAAFDSGAGGLAIARELLKELPEEKLFYFGDTGHMPYGARTLENIRDLSETIALNLLALPAKVIVVACNTASAASLAHLRERFPGRLFVGMEPAVKPAVNGSKNGRIGVLATPATFEGEPFKRLRDQYAADAEIYSRPCPGLAETIERHGPGKETADLLRTFINPLLEKKIDRLVLACTHYSLVADEIADIAGPAVQVVDPSPAIARRVRQVLGEAGLERKGKGALTVRVSGDPEAFSIAAARALGQPVAVERADFF